jgi:hypothetical protein
MTIQLYKAATGEKALVVNHQLILDGELEDDSASLVELIGERLAAALRKTLHVVDISPENADWSWEKLLSEDSTPALELMAAACTKCGSLLKGGMCSDETCCFSEWPQQVATADMMAMSADEIAAKYGLIRAEAHSDDGVFAGNFLAEAWFIAASSEMIKSLAEEGWGRCQEADEVARSARETPGVGRMFDYLQARNAGGSPTIGFECTVNAEDALAWLRRQRHGLWAQIVCEENGIRIVEAQEPEIEGLFDWLDDHGNACEMSLVSEDEAAVDAISKLGLISCGPVMPLYDAFWDASMFHSQDGKDIRQIVGNAMFCEGLGYSPEDIDDIKALSVGESWECPNFGPCHTVRRVR